MDNINFKNLSKISIDGSGLINANANIDPVYNFCKLNNINNIGDFIKIYKEKLAKGEISKKNNIEYMNGFVDLINLVYCGIPLADKELLLRKIYLKQGSSSNYCDYMQFINCKSSLRRLGFTNNERNTLLNYVACINKDLTIIETIKSYIVNDCGIKLRQSEQFIFDQKLKIFVNYYEKGLNFRTNLIGSDFYKIELLLNKYEKLLITKNEIENNIASIEKEMQCLIKSLNDNDVKQLQKKYPNKEFIAKK